MDTWQQRGRADRLPVLHAICRGVGSRFSSPVKEEQEEEGSEDEQETDEGPTMTVSDPHTKSTATTPPCAPFLLLSRLFSLSPSYHTLPHGLRFWPFRCHGRVQAGHGGHRRRRSSIPTHRFLFSLLLHQPKATSPAPLLLTRDGYVVTATANNASEWQP